MPLITLASSGEKDYINQGSITGNQEDGVILHYIEQVMNYRGKIAYRTYNQFRLHSDFWNILQNNSTGVMPVNQKQLFRATKKIKKKVKKLEKHAKRYLEALDAKDKEIQTIKAEREANSAKIKEQEAEIQRLRKALEEMETRSGQPKVWANGADVLDAQQETVSKVVKEEDNTA